MYQIGAILYVLAMGLQATAATNIGQQIGKGNIVAAKGYLKASAVVCVFAVAICMSLIYCFHN